MAEYVRKRDKALSILTNGQVFDRGMRNVIVRVYPQEGVLGVQVEGAEEQLYIAGTEMLHVGNDSRYIVQEEGKEEENQQEYNII